MHEGIGVPDAQTASIFEPGDEAHGLPPVLDTIISCTASNRRVRMQRSKFGREYTLAAVRFVRERCVAVARVACAGRNECAWGSGKSTRETVPAAVFCSQPTD
jgi:hypothetical protein